MNGSEGLKVFNLKQAFVSLVTTVKMCFVFFPGRLKQVLNDLLRQQQSQSFSGQQQHQNVARDSASPSLFLNYPPVNTLNMPGLPNFSPFSNGKSIIYLLFLKLCKFFKIIFKLTSNLKLSFSLLSCI